MDIEIGGDTFTKKPSILEEIDDLARQVQSIGRYMHDHSIKIGYRREE